MEKDNGGKGIWWQIQNGYAKTELPKAVTPEDIKGAFEYYDNLIHRKRKEDNERIDHNINHLNARSKELGKPIPTVLLAMTYINRPVGSWVFEEYKEWF